MASWTRRAVVLAVVVGVCGAVGPACADNNQTLFIRQVQAPDSAECTFSADPSEMHLMSGIVDLMFRSQYDAALLVGNQLVPQGRQDLVRAETSRIQLTEAEVVVEYPDGTGVNSFSIPGNGFVDPGNGTEPGWGVFGTVLIDGRTADILRGALGVTGAERSSKIGRVVARVRVRGETLGNKDVESGEFRFPIEFCYGCMLTFPSGRTLDDGSGLPNCRGCADATDISDGGCRPGQDSLVDCCNCHSMFGAEDLRCEPAQS